MGTGNGVEEQLQGIVILFGKGLQDHGSTHCFHAQ